MSDERAKLSAEALSLLRAVQIACAACKRPAVVFDGQDRCWNCRPLPPKKPAVP
jgi:hypothetical protein